MKISVIVPVYNAEKYLHRCIDSILSQTLDEIELILINDCSTDNSINIINSYKSYDNVKIIDLEENIGPGGARNNGLSCAQGYFICFVDSDDYIDKTMLETLYKIATRGKHDIVDCKFYHEGLDKEMKTTSNNALGKLDLTKKRELILHSGFVWGKIIRTSIIKSNNILFREKVSYEDIDFIREVIVNCKKVYSTDKLLYFHTANPTSLTNTDNISIKIYDKMASMEALYNYFIINNLYNDYREELTYIIYKTYAVILDYVMKLDTSIVTVSLFKELQDFFYKLVKYDYSNNIYINSLPKEDRIFAETNNRDYTKLINYI